MPTAPGPRRPLPADPSLEFLRKEAKRLARAEATTLGAAQRALAHRYGPTPSSRSPST